MQHSGKYRHQQCEQRRDQHCEQVVAHPGWLAPNPKQYSDTTREDAFPHISVCFTVRLAWLQSWPRLKTTVLNGKCVFRLILSGCVCPECGGRLLFGALIACCAPPVQRAVQNLRDNGHLQCRVGILHVDRVFFKRCGRIKGF